MKVSFIVPCRDKASFVAKTVESVFAQTYSPMEIILSDQGSVDGTFEIITELAAKYNGPNSVRVLQCPDTELRGMAGLNQHLNWLHTQVTGDIIIMCSADDLNHPDRTKYTVEAFEKHNPSYVGTCVQYLNAEQQLEAITAFNINGEEDCFVDPIRNINELIGSSASSAWSKDLYEKYGPLKGIESQDVLLPFFATIERGIFYVGKQLHAYIKHADENNTGLEGVMRAAQKKLDNAQNDVEKVIASRPLNACIENVNYHCTSNYFAILRRLQGLQSNIDMKLYEALLNKAIDASNLWAQSRDNLTLMRVEPKGMRV